MTDPLKFATDLAAETGKLLLDFYQNQNTKAKRKHDNTLITQADLEADELIRGAIQDAFPNDNILSEEDKHVYLGADNPTWVIDPIDGTSNFSLGIHYWGVSIARIVNGHPDTAALCFPVFNELYAAKYGQGATLNGARTQTKYQDGQLAAFFTCCSRTHQNYKVTLRIKPRILGSAAYNFCAIASGRSVLGFEATPKIWDIAASWLVLTEAGGAVAPYGPDPFPLQIGKNYEGVKFPLLGAANTELLAIGKERIVKKHKMPQPVG